MWLREGHRRLGVCVATSRARVLHLLNGLYDAKLDGQPAVAITGMPYHDLIDTLTQQDVELDKLFADVAIYNQRIMGPTHVENVANLACRSALAYRGWRTSPSRSIQEKEVGGDRAEAHIPGSASDAFARSDSCLPKMRCGGRPTCSTRDARWRFWRGAAHSARAMSWSRSRELPAARSVSRCSGKLCVPG